MKRFKIGGLLAIIALVAMSFTLATNAKFKKSKDSKKLTTTCYLNQPPKVSCSTNSYPSFSGGQQTQTFSQVCVTIPSNTTAEADPINNCDADYSQICCYELETTTSCSGCTSGFDGKVTRVFFKD